MGVDCGMGSTSGGGLAPPVNVPAGSQQDSTPDPEGDRIVPFGPVESEGGGYIPADVSRGGRRQALSNGRRRWTWGRPAPNQRLPVRQTLGPALAVGGGWPGSGLQWGRADDAPGLWAGCQRQDQAGGEAVPRDGALALVGALRECVFDVALVRAGARAASLVEGLRWVRRAPPAPD